MGRVIGIDLGTTNCVAAYWRKRRPKPIYNAKGSPFLPSVVMIEQGHRTVGQDARDRIGGSKNVAYSIKRFIGRDYGEERVQKALAYVGYETRKALDGEVEVLLDGQYYSPVEISAMILEQLRKDAEVELGEPVTHAVITVPAYFGQRQKNATREAGQLAGLHVLRVINEPTAAALAFGIEEESSQPRQILVYDLGGGTFDISVLMVSGSNFDVLHVDGDNFLGGDLFDQRVVDELLARIGQESGEDLSQNQAVKYKLKTLAERAKMDLSYEEQFRIQSSALAETNKGGVINLDYVLTRSRLEELVMDLVDHSIDITHRALREAHLDADDIDRVLLVGGMTRMPLIRGRLKEMFGDKIEIDVEPMQCVGLGAAVQTTIPIEWLCPHCQSINEGTEDVCRSCGKPQELYNENEEPRILCDECTKPNRQGRRYCWSCGAPIGATFADRQTATITDITSMYIGVEYESENSSKFLTVIEKGEPYPTDTPLRYELYTNRLGQEYYRLPVYEAETRDAPREKWVHVGVVTNEKLPPGLPGSTPIMVEMRIDGDGVLTVQSYVKRMERETLVEGKFSFGSARPEQSGQSAETLALLGTFAFALKSIANFPDLNKFLDPGQAEQALALVAEAESVTQTKDEAQAGSLLERIYTLIRKMPVPTWDVFLGRWAAAHPETSTLQRSQADQTIMEMERAASAGDYDSANRYLSYLRQQTQDMFEKLPSDLLRVNR